MSRQFRSDDTSPWGEKFGNGAAGSVNISGTYGTGVSNGGYCGTAAGSAGAYQLTTPNGWGIGSYGGWPCFIHQTQGSGYGNWELNFISSISGTTSTLRYPLQRTYGTGAQCYLAIPYYNVTVTSTLTAPAWDGTKGGFIFLMALNSFTNNSIINCNGANSQRNVPSSQAAAFPINGGGFRGGFGQDNGSGDQNKAQQGESGVGTGAQTYTANGAGGGAGTIDDHQGGGGGHKTAGTNGTGGGGSGGYNGLGGGIVGNNELTLFNLGSGGGGGTEWQNDCYDTSGSNGGASILVISKTITNNGTISCNGGVAITDSEDDKGIGGSGSGGAMLFKGQTLVLNGTMTVNGGTRQHEWSGQGGVGYMHADYMLSCTGTYSSIDKRVDYSYRLGRNSGSIII